MNDICACICLHVNAYTHISFLMHNTIFKTKSHKKYNTKKTFFIINISTLLSIP